MRCQIAAPTCLSLQRTAGRGSGPVFLLTVVTAHRGPTPRRKHAHPGVSARPKSDGLQMGTGDAAPARGLQAEGRCGGPRAG